MLSHQKVVLIGGDIAAFLLSFCAMALIRFDVGAQVLRVQIQLFAFMFIIWLIVFFIFDLYNIRRVNPNPRNIGLIIAAMATNTLLAIVLFYIVPNTGITPKTNLVILVLCTLISMIVWRRIFYLLFTRRFVRRILLIGQSPFIQHLAQELAAHRQMGTVIATWDMIPKEITDTEANLIIAEGVSPEALLRLSHELQTETLSLVEAYETIFGKIPVEFMTDEKAIHLLANRTTPAQQVLYRLFEIIGAVLVLIAVSPFLLIAILARWIEDGAPIFVTQKRVGKGGKVFTIHKLRSMKALNADGSAESSGAQWADKSDTRITPVGRILRKTHLDEVPQMWNIIKGDLAVIGPRPERPEFVAQLEQEIPYYYLRHTIKPGFTGWAQIKFRYAATILDSREKFEYDLYYLKNKHPLLDIGIVLKTLQIIFTH